MLIDKNKSTLIIVDVQEKLLSVMPKPYKFLDNIIKLLKAAGILDIQRMYSEQYPKGLGCTVDKIMKHSPGIRIEKTDFAIPIKNQKIKEQCIICGIESHICVLQTAINLSQNKKVYVIQDAISSRFEKDYLTALNRLDKYPDIEVVSCEMVLFEWLKKSGTNEFKQISQLIK